jgi:hypothetical protein
VSPAQFELVTIPAIIADGNVHLNNEALNTLLAMPDLAGRKHIYEPSHYHHHYHKLTDHYQV